MKPGRNSFLDDPALALMGLVPARYALSGGDDHRRSASSWRAAWGALAIGSAAVIALFWSTVTQIIGVWYNSATFNHAFLILPICGYVAWLKRGNIANQVPQPSIWGVVAILVAGSAWLLGFVASAAAVEQFSLVFMLQGLVLAIFGPKITRSLAFPLAYMLFAVPFGQFMIPPLQDLTAVFVVKGLQIVHIPVFLDGVFISIPTGNFEVASACSGIRYLIATLALGILFAHIMYRSRWRQAAFIGLSFIVPIVANGLRAFGIVLLAYLSDNELATGVDHIVYGWVFFSFITIILLLVGMAFRDGGMEEIAANADAARVHEQNAVTQRRIGTVALVAVIAAAVAPAYASYIAARPIPHAPHALPVPAVGGGWRVSAAGQTGWSPVYPSAPVTLSRRYAKGNDRVDLFIAYYETQRLGAELIHFQNNIANFHVWGRAASNMASVDLGRERLTVERSRLIQRGQLGRIVYRWYWVDGRFTENAYVAKAYQALGHLFNGQEAAAAIIVSAPFDEVPEEADRALRDFLKNVQPIAPLLGRVSENAEP